MHDQLKTYEELLEEQEELRHDNESLKVKYKQAVAKFDQAESELVSLQMKFQKSIDSTSNAVNLLDKKYRLLVDSANEAIVVIKGGFLCLTNPITKTITGYSEEEIGTIPFQLFIHPEDRARVVDNHLKRLMGGRYPKLLCIPTHEKRWIHPMGLYERSTD